jgi:hypothetical protein
VLMAAAAAGTDPFGTAAAAAAAAVSAACMLPAAACTAAFLPLLPLPSPALPPRGGAKAASDRAPGFPDPAAPPLRVTMPPPGLLLLLPMQSAASS